MGMSGRKNRSSETPRVTMGHAVDRCDASEECSVVTWATMGVQMEVGGTRKFHCGLRWYFICGGMEQGFCLEKKNKAYVSLSQSCHLD